MSKVIIGIDGGGTKSHLGIFSVNGDFLGFFTYGTLNHELMPKGFEQLEETLNQIIGEALQSVNKRPSDVAYAVFGLAGVDTREQHEIISLMLKRIGIEKFTLCNDGYLGVPAGCPKGAGICAINGTGSVLTAIDINGKMYQVGGIGDITDDHGGSSWYGSQLLKNVYCELFKSAPKTMMTQLLFTTKLFIGHRDLYTEAITLAMEANSIDYPALNQLVFSAAGQGDFVANQILEDSAEHYAKCIEFLANNLEFPKDETLYITLAGSIFVREKVETLPILIKKRVCELLGDRPVEFIKLQDPPVIGAILWAFREIGTIVDINKIREGISE